MNLNPSCKLSFQEIMIEWSNLALFCSGFKCFFVCGGVMGDEISKKGLSVFGCFFMGVGERMKWLRSSQEQEKKRKLLQVPKEGKIKCYFSHQNNVILPKRGEV